SKGGTLGPRPLGGWLQVAKEVNPSIISESSKYMRDWHMSGCLKLRTSAAAFIVSVICASLALPLYSQTSPTNPDRSWTATSHTALSNADPTRTTESRVTSGNRTVVKKTVEVLDPDGQYQPYLYTETETIQESATATRSTTRTYTPGPDRQQHLTQVSETETRNSSDGLPRTVRTTSNPDGEGNFRVSEREVTTTTGTPELRKTQTTIYLPNIEGKLAPGVQIEEREARRANGDTDKKKTTLVPDGNGEWQVYELREQTIKGDSQNRTTQERT